MTSPIRLRVSQTGKLTLPFTRFPFLGNWKGVGSFSMLLFLMLSMSLLQAHSSFHLCIKVHLAVPEFSFGEQWLNSINNQSISESLVHCSFSKCLINIPKIKVLALRISYVKFPAGFLLSPLSGCTYICLISTLCKLVLNIHPWPSLWITDNSILCSWPFT